MEAKIAILGDGHAAKIAAARIVQQLDADIYMYSFRAAQSHDALFKKAIYLHYADQLIDLLDYHGIDYNIVPSNIYVNRGISSPIISFDTIQTYFSPVEKIKLVDEYLQKSRRKRFSMDSLYAMNWILDTGHSLMRIEECASEICNKLIFAVGNHINCQQAQTLRVTSDNVIVNGGNKDQFDMIFTTIPFDIFVKNNASNIFNERKTECHFFAIQNYAAKIADRIYCNEGIYMVYDITQENDFFRETRLDNDCSLFEYEYDVSAGLPEKFFLQRLIPDHYSDELIRRFNQRFIFPIGRLGTWREKYLLTDVITDVDSAIGNWKNTPA